MRCQVICTFVDRLIIIIIILIILITLLYTTKKVYRCYKNLFERSCSLSCEFIDLYFSSLFERVCFFDGSIDLYFSKQFEGSSYFLSGSIGL